ncbi:cupin domain-containing protein [Halomicrobium salinisoli]|uniref:cupin domain-containing protein n=1 Tax=Halomicrobium salinisoli TaxID=2878391 RepID=UPI001CF012B0|nr:cupin domain-containing protein [Halomicrobium salinisoli]
MTVERADLSAVAEDGRASLFEGEPRTVYLSLSADERIPEHTHPDREILFHVLEGEIDLDLDGETHSLEAGEIARFSGEREISPSAATDARALVVLANGEEA